MKIYTGRGDRGLTSLANGRETSKGDMRVETYGRIDELNVYVGMLRQTLLSRPAINQQLIWIQNKLFDLGAYISYAQGDWIRYEYSNVLEQWIDQMQAELPVLKSFILPGGCQSALYAHLCRTRTRSVERLVVRLYNEESTQEEGGQKEGLLVFINRLSDYFFVLAKYVNQLEGIQETFWVQE